MAPSSTLLDAFNVFAIINGIEKLTGNNFTSWKENIEDVLTILDLDYVFRVDPPLAPTPDEINYTQLKKVYDINLEKWQRANRKSLMIMKSSISEEIRGAFPKSDKAREYLANIEEMFKVPPKAYASTLVRKLLNTKYDGSGSIREHINMMIDISSELKSIGMSISDGFLVHFIMMFLPPEYTSLRIDYNIQKDQWTLGDLTTMCVQEEERLKTKNKDIVNFVGSRKRKANNDIVPRQNSNTS